MPKSTLPLFALLAVITVFSGCANNDQKQKQQSPDQNKQTQTPTSTTPTSTQATTTPKEDLPVWPEEKFTEEDYKGWKTYTHEELGYQIKYPSDWTINACDEKCASKEVIINPPDGEMFVGYISIYLSEDLNYIRKTYKDPEECDGNPYEEEEVLFTNKRAYHFFDGDLPESEFIIVPHNNKNFNISTQKNNHPKVIQSLASFEFIE